MNPSALSFARRFSPSRRLGPVVLVAACTALIGGCLGGDDKADGRSYTTEVIDIDRDAGVITTRDVYYYCDDIDDVVADTIISQERFEIAGQRLYRWEGGYSCMANRLSGTSTDIVGTWTANPPVYADAPVNDDAYCDAVTLSDRQEFNTFLRSATITEKITEAGITTTVSGEVCWAEQWGWLLITNAGMDGEIEITERDCSSATLENADGETAQVTARELGDALAVKFTSGGASCEVRIKDDNGQAACSDPDNSQTALESCAYGSGFFGEAPFWKNGQGKKGREITPHYRADDVMRRALRGL